MLNVTRTAPSDNATWRDALALIANAGQSFERCACGLSADVLRFDVVEEFSKSFVCVDCAAVADPNGHNFYLRTSEGFEPWENILDTTCFA